MILTGRVRGQERTFKVEYSDLKMQTIYASIYLPMFWYMKDRIMWASGGEPQPLIYVSSPSGPAPGFQQILQIFYVDISMRAPEGHCGKNR